MGTLLISTHIVFYWKIRDISNDTFKVALQQVRKCSKVITKGVLRKIWYIYNFWLNAFMNPFECNLKSVITNVSKFPLYTYIYELPERNFKIVIRNVSKFPLYTFITYLKTFTNCLNETLNLLIEMFLSFRYTHLLLTLGHLRTVWIKL